MIGFTISHNTLKSNSKSIPLLWNRFRITFYRTKFYIQYNVLVESQRLGVFKLSTTKSEKRLLRLELMKHLNKIGYSNREITDFFNINNIKKVRTNTPYNPKDIWIGLKKYNERLDRFKRDKILRITEGFYVSELPKKKGLY